MKQKKRAASSVNLRKTPLQRRSAETVNVIVEAAARILESRGFEGFNTNVVAESAGVSVGSLYQYFPSKHALLSALIEREMKPMLIETEELGGQIEFKAALHLYVSSSVKNQMRRPELARLIDLAEKQEVFHEQITSTVSRFLAVLEKMLVLRDAPKVSNRSVAAADLVAVIRALTDAAGERGERASTHLIQRIESTVYGYLKAPVR